MRAVALGASVLVTGAAHAALAFDQNVTPGVIFGNGNANGGFTVATNGGVELGLRAKLRHDPANGGAPQNIFNSNGDGSHSFAAGAWTGSGGGPTTAYWSVEFSINTNTSGTNGLQLDDLTYEFGRDTDPTAAGQSYLTGDPINVAFADNGMGDNTTVQCNGTNSNPGCHDTRNMSTSPADYVAYATDAPAMPAPMIRKSLCSGGVIVIGGVSFAPVPAPVPDRRPGRRHARARPTAAADRAVPA